MPWSTWCRLQVSSDLVLDVRMYNADVRFFCVYALVCLFVEGEKKKGKCLSLTEICWNIMLSYAVNSECHCSFHSKLLFGWLIVLFGVFGVARLKRSFDSFLSFLVDDFNILLLPRSYNIQLANVTFRR